MAVAAEMTGAVRLAHGVELLEGAGDLARVGIDSGEDLVGEEQPTLWVLLHPQPSFDDGSKMSRKNSRGVGLVDFATVDLHAEQALQACCQLVCDDVFVQPLVHGGELVTNDRQPGRDAARARRS
ncbi:hypothetical protein GCM10009737_33160 [Nocardioides lentus]|uniref:Uncharacterized protein n=1 Tax=Nocardioides lentus TaxID=338077 RepID=A0ABN2PQ59_9ACTN